MNKKTKETQLPAKLRLMLALCSILLAVPGLKAQPPGKVKLSIRFAEVTLDAAVRQLKEASPVNIAYDAGKLRLSQWSISPKEFRQTDLSEILHYLLQKTDVSYKEVAGGIVLFEKNKPAAAVKKDPGKLTGKIIDEENGEPISGATIRVAGKAAVSDIDGSFRIELPAGKYTATFSFVGFGTKEVSDIEITGSHVFYLDLTMKREKGNLSAVVVRGSARRESVAALLIRQKNAAGITDGISAEQISRTPDKNIAESLKRISGLSSLDNKYVVVRGLSERYNQALLNGQVMPSTELNRKNFSYDIIPSGFVDNVVVTKSLTPDLSAEFGGGLVQVNTKDIPDRDFLSITVGSSVNDNTTGKNFRSLKMTNNQYFSGVPDHRKLFGSLDYKSRQEIVSNDNFAPLLNSDGTPSGEYNLKDAGKFSNNWGLYNYTALPGFNGQLAGGKLIPLKKEDARLGVMASVSYRTNWQTQPIRMSRDGYFPASVLTDKAGFSGTRYGFTSNIGALAGIGYTTAKHKLSLQTIYLRTLDQQFVLGVGDHNTYSTTAGYYDIFTVTSLWQNQLKSEHVLGKKGIRLNLALSHTQLDRNKPDNHQANFSFLKKDSDDPSNPDSDFSVTNVYSTGINAGSLRWWSRALENNLAWNADLSIPFRFSVAKLAVNNILKTGYAGWYKDRQFWVLVTGSRFFNNGDSEPLSEFFNAADGGDVFAPRFGDDFHKKPILHAGYAMLDHKIGKKLRLVWGARAEYFNLNGVNGLLEGFINSQRTNNRDLTDYSDLLSREPNLNFFPSANLTYSLTKKINLRLGWSESIIRPDLRETSFFKEYDFELGGSYWSEAPLVSTKIKHADFRFEYYPSAGEVLSASFFYKKLLYPMEIFAKENRLFELKNDKDAINKGIELEVRKSFAFTGIPILKNITLSGNFTKMFSKVRTMNVNYRADDNDLYKLRVTESVNAEEDRPQSGASNIMYNAAIYYDSKWFNISVSYNHIANRFYRVGTADVGSLYEQPLNPLDAQVAIRLLKQKATLKLNAGNLLNGKYIIYNNMYEGGEFAPQDGHKPSTKELLYQKGTDVLDYEAAPGRTWSVSFSYNF